MLPGSALKTQEALRWFAFFAPPIELWCPGLMAGLASAIVAAASVSNAKHDATTFMAVLARAPRFERGA